LHSPIETAQGLREGGIALPEEWPTIARLADLPALCDLLAREAMPSEFVPEIRDLIDATAGLQNQLIEK